MRVAHDLCVPRGQGQGVAQFGHFVALLTEHLRDVRRNIVI
jgi:hypothetical protein